PSTHHASPVDRSSVCARVRARVREAKPRGGTAYRVWSERKNVVVVRRLSPHDVSAETLIWAACASEDTVCEAGTTPFHLPVSAAPMFQVRLRRCFCALGRCLLCVWPMSQCVSAETSAWALPRRDFASSTSVAIL